MKIHTVSPPIHQPSSPPIYVENARRLPLWTLAAQRTPVGIAGDYKPSVALLPDGSLLLAAYRSWDGPEGAGSQCLLWRSSDGGETWSDREERTDVIGWEPYVSCMSDGTLFITTSVLAEDVANLDQTYMAWLHRSTDGGSSWERTKVLIKGKERCGVPLNSRNGGALSRNLAELPDGTLLCGACMNEGNGVAYLWRSRDRGRTWDHGAPVRIGDYRGRPYDNFDGFFHENWLFVTQSGKLLNWIRCGPPSPMFPLDDGRPQPDVGDQSDRMLVYESSDGGRTWRHLRDFGGYGIMYPRATRLQDGRVLVTYTQRSLYPPLGLRAIISQDDEGQTWDFENDQIIIDGRTPLGGSSGGGFGNTVQLADGALVSCYSYRGADDQVRLEVARWRLPISMERPFFFDGAVLDLADQARLEVLHDWRENSAVNEELCNLNVRGAGQRHANVNRTARRVNAELFIAELEFLSEAETDHVSPALALTGFFQSDWSEYAAVAMRLHNPTDQTQQIGLTARTVDGTCCWQMTDYAPGETGTLFVDLIEARSRMRVDQMDMLMLHSPRSPRKRTFLVGPVCLVKSNSCQ